MLAKDIKNQFPDSSEEDLESIIKRYKEADSWWDTTYVSEDAFNRLEDIMIYNDSLKEKVDFKTIVTNKFNESNSKN